MLRNGLETFWGNKDSYAANCNYVKKMVFPEPDGTTIAINSVS
jgi:hypothetical protein